jgi:hypothetical protein
MERSKLKKKNTAMPAEKLSMMEYIHLWATGSVPEV